jgi:hypothetical protein
MNAKLLNFFCVPALICAVVLLCLGCEDVVHIGDDNSEKGNQDNDQTTTTTYTPPAGEVPVGTNAAGLVVGSSEWLQAIDSGRLQ